MKSTKQKTVIRLAALYFAMGFLLLVGWELTGCSTVQPPQTRDPAFPFWVEQKTLKNGLKILVLPDSTSPTLAYQTWFKVGSRDEEVGKTGLAHLFEHMMFKGTRNRPEGEFDRALEQMGAEGQNAFTSRDYTAYVQEIPKTQLEQMMQIESDRMVNLIVDERSFKTETEVVQNERRYRNENNPIGTLFQEIFEVAFKKHSYRWPVIGYAADLEAMTAADALDFYQKYYHPGQATLVISGDVKPSEVFSLAEKYYGAIPSRESSRPQLVPEPPSQAPLRKKMKLNIQVEKMMVGYRVPGVLHEDIPALTVLNSVLSGGKSSRLHRALVETGLATDAGAFDIDDQEESLFLFLIGLQKGKKGAQVEAVLLRELERLTREKVGTAELARALTSLEFGFYQGLETHSSRAQFVGQFESIAHNYQIGIDLFKRISKVTAEDLQRVAKTYFKPQSRVVLQGVPL